MARSRVKLPIGRTGRHAPARNGKGDGQNGQNGQNGQVGVQADYLFGDPSEPEAITGGTLALVRGGLLFRGPGRADMRIGIDELQGMTVSGARSRGSNGTRRRGTTRLAAYLGNRPTVLEFAIDRSKAVLLRERINRTLEKIGRSPLPFVEALYDFDIPPPPRILDGPAVDTAEARIDRIGRRAKREVPGKVYSQPNRQRRIIFAIIGAVVAAEVIATLLVLFVL